MNKQIINTDYGTFKYVLSVQGSPAILLINRGSGPVEGWHRLFPELDHEYTVLAYNRLGIGKSSKLTGLQHGAVITATLKLLLDDLHAPPPYVLVGHFLGGLYANLLARPFPGQIAGYTARSQSPAGSAD
ncbi:alpha/beta fold hydrolase [Paenibacillus bovis]|uniref:alpha/beta fold hydrolase n=1 Tax=Paenibacillus bovis TaxID=1616788 RepID=UPI000760F26A|nr:alpha/beta hydrolase [Paenibacillus bovis]